MGDDLKRRAQPWLGTLVEVAVPSDDVAAIDRAFAHVARVHKLMSFHAEDSDLAAIRRASPSAVLRLDPLTVVVLREAARLHALSEGVFDVTIGSQLVAWGFLPRPPGTDLRAFRGARMSDLEFCGDAQVRLRRPLLIDLGGIAKGFAVDGAVEALREAGVSRGIVNAGGDLRVFGDIQAPVALRAADWSGLSASLMLRDCALATSSNLHARRTARGERSAHVGRHRRAVLCDDVVAVQAPSAMIADALTKVVMADADLGRRVALQLGAQVRASPPLCTATR